MQYRMKRLTVGRVGRPGMCNRSIIAFDKYSALSFAQHIQRFMCQGAPIKPKRTGEKGGDSYPYDCMGIFHQMIT